MRKFILLIISTAFLLGCNQTIKGREEKPTENKQTNDVVDTSVSLSIEPNIFKLSELPEMLKVTITNNTNDTITTGLHYRIENYKNNEWEQVSPDQVFVDLGIILKPSDSHTFDKKLLSKQIDYKVGKYRIVKHYLKSDYQKTREKFNVYAEFEVD